jgi:hypothetical protein
MTHEMIHSLWFDGKAHEAAAYYKSIFPDFTAISENALAVNYRMGGRRFMHLNGVQAFRSILPFPFLSIWKRKRKFNKFGINYPKAVRF